MDAAVDIRPTFNPLGFLSAAAPIRAHVAGQGPYQLEWNQVLRVPVPAGDVMVVIWSSWVTKKFMGTSHARLSIPPGQQVGLEWKMPSTVFGTGKLKVADLAPTAYHAQLTVAELPPDAGPCGVAAPHATRPLTAVVAAAPVPIAAPVAPPAGAWHPDPTGRYPLRWWDGQRWTETASDGTTTFPDPVPGL